MIFFILTETNKRYFRQKKQKQRVLLIDEFFHQLAILVVINTSIYRPALELRNVYDNKGNLFREKESQIISSAVLFLLSLINATATKATVYMLWLMIY